MEASPGKALTAIIEIYTISVHPLSFMLHSSGGIVRAGDTVRCGASSVSIEEQQKKPGTGTPRYYSI